MFSQKDLQLLLQVLDLLLGPLGPLVAPLRVRLEGRQLPRYVLVLALRVTQGYLRKYLLFCLS